MDLTLIKKDYLEHSPKVQMAPLIDIVFLLLIFFMSAFVYYELETEIDITVPVSSEASETQRTPGKIILNVKEDGTVVVNQRTLSFDALDAMLARVSELYSNQPVIIRGDRETRYKNIIKLLDICASRGIWNVSFATMKEDK